MTLKQLREAIQRLQRPAIIGSKSVVYLVDVLTVLDHADADAAKVKLSRKVGGRGECSGCHKEVGNLGYHAAHECTEAGD